MSTKEFIVKLGWIAAFIGVSYAVAATVGQTQPAAVNGCVYNSSPPTLSDGQQGVFQCDASGNLKTKAQ